MRRWVARLLEASHAARLVILDAEGELLHDELEELHAAVVHDWWALWRAWQPHDGSARSLLVVRAEKFARPEDLPWVIARSADVVSIRPPVAPKLAPLWRALDADAQDRLVERLGVEPGGRTALGEDAVAVALLETGWGLHVPRDEDPIAQFRSAVAAKCGGMPTAVLDYLRSSLTDELARAVVADPPDTGTLQRAVDDWLAHGSGSRWWPTLGSSGSEVLTLHEHGIVRVHSSNAPDLPGWLSWLDENPSAADNVAALLDRLPESAPNDWQGWFDLAAAWAEVRYGLVALVGRGPGLEAHAWDWWTGMDAAFVSWMARGVTELTNAPSPWPHPPTTLSNLASFLARRHHEGLAPRIALLVLDGLGLAQWTQIRIATGIRVAVDAHAVAMAPSLTTVSRRSIFCGTWPSRFDTSPWEAGGLQSSERQGWKRLWATQYTDDPVTAVEYKRVNGAGPAELDELARLADRVTVLGVVVSAVDEMMHGAELLGDAVFSASIDAWLAHGFLVSLIGMLHDRGFEVWVTSDHGNLDAVAGPRPRSEGLGVGEPGSRVRRYATAAQRDTSDVTGIAWEPPGLPPDGSAFLFAGGRSFFPRSGSGRRVVHGGLSFDEMIVPVALVEPGP